MPNRRQVNNPELIEQTSPHWFSIQTKVTGWPEISIRHITKVFKAEEWFEQEIQAGIRSVDKTVERFLDCQSAFIGAIEIKAEHAIIPIGSVSELPKEVIEASIAWVWGDDTSGQQDEISVDLQLPNASNHAKRLLEHKTKGGWTVTLEVTAPQPTKENASYGAVNYGKLYVTIYLFTYLHECIMMIYIHFAYL